MVEWEVYAYNGLNGETSLVIGDSCDSVCLNKDEFLKVFPLLLSEAEKLGWLKKNVEKTP